MLKDMLKVLTVLIIGYALIMWWSSVSHVGISSYNFGTGLVDKEKMWSPIDTGKH